METTRESKYFFRETSNSKIIMGLAFEYFHGIWPFMSIHNTRNITKRMNLFEIQKAFQVCLKVLIFTFLISLCFICSFRAHYYLTLYLQATYFPQYPSIANHSDVNHGIASRVTCHVSRLRCLRWCVRDAVLCCCVLLRLGTAVTMGRMLWDATVRIIWRPTAKCSVQHIAALPPPPTTTSHHQPDI